MFREERKRKYLQCRCSSRPNRLDAVCASTSKRFGKRKEKIEILSNYSLSYQIYSSLTGSKAQVPYKTQRPCPARRSPDAHVRPTSPFQNTQALLQHTDTSTHISQDQCHTGIWGGSVDPRRPYPYTAGLICRRPRFAQAPSSS